MQHTKEAIDIMRDYDHSVKYISSWSQGRLAREKNEKTIKRLETLGYKDFSDTDIWEAVKQYDEEIKNKKTLFDLLTDDNKKKALLPENYLVKSILQGNFTWLTVSIGEAVTLTNIFNYDLFNYHELEKLLKQ